MSKLNYLNIFKSFYYYLDNRFDKFRYLIYFLLKIVTLALSFVSPYIYMLFVDKIIIGLETKLLPYIIISYIMVFICNSIISVFNNYLYNKIFMNFNLHIRQSLFEKLSSMNAKGYNKYNLGDIKKRLIDDIDVVERFMGSYVPDFIYSILYVIGIVCFLIFLNWILALVSILMVPISFWINRLLSKKSKTTNEKYRKLSGNCSGFLYHIMQNWKEIKTSNLQELQVEKYKGYGYEIFKLSVKQEKYRTINLTLRAIKEFFITKMILYFVGGMLIMAKRMTVGALLVFVNYYEAFYSNISRIMDISFSYETDKASINRVLEIMEFTNEYFVNYETDNYKIDVQNICFRYSDDTEYVIKDLNLSINENEHVGIIGKSGCGKSTLAKLLAGMYSSDKGNIFIGGLENTKTDYRILTRKICIVSQENILFNLSIKENLLMVNRNATNRDLDKACIKANIYDFIQSLPDKYNTLIGENGMQMSGGQRQRLAIARVILINSKIIIFDEASSSLDKENEEQLIENINKYMSDKTIIFITHRIESAYKLHRLIIMKDGMIVEDKNLLLSSNKETETIC